MVPAIGYAIREQNRPILDDPAINAVEITFERADDPLRIDRYLEDEEFDLVSIHALKLSVASPDPPNWGYLEALRAIADENGAESISDHLGFTRDREGGVEIGRFSAPPYTEAALDATCRNIELIQRFFGDRRFYVETIAYLFQLERTMSEAEFTRRLLERTGCGWLLDVTNVYANGLNFAFDPREFIAHVVPAASSVQMHLAGGFWDQQAGMYIDSHSHPIPPDVWTLYREALRQAGDKTTAVFVERDQNFPEPDDWRREIRKVREVAESTCNGRSRNPKPVFMRRPDGVRT